MVSLRPLWLVVFGLALGITPSQFSQRSNYRSNATPESSHFESSGVSNDEVDEARRASDSATVVEAEGTLLLSTLGEFGRIKRAHGVTAAQVASYIFSHAPEHYSPPGCVNAALSGSTTVVLNFNDCSGRHGLQKLTGTLVEAVSVDVAGVHINATASGLNVGLTTMDIDSTSTISTSAGRRSMSVSTHGAGTGPLGNSIVRDGEYTVTWNSHCRTTDGSWALTRGESTRSTTTHITRCAQQCPSGTITRTSSSRKLTITFDGSSVATWSTSDGLSGSINLVCLP